ncbi:hypothetical protein PVAND_004480 [Polypedilum vanderplanki]|uniref:C2H2-type domain-containing protein n=1 Tax=Polypedilum vanderplanki TaxID=319348 RepID=A0A9J6BZ88_POLVA|nr:hypothetical protein PVAND_004480 [Polypedilum vanderplanki]
MSSSTSKHPRKSYCAAELARKDYKCSICLQEFSTENQLKDHEEIHVTPYCHFCSKMFKSAKLLRVHHQTYHNDQVSSLNNSNHSSSSSASKESKHNSSKNDTNNVCEDLSLSKIKEEPIELVSEPEIENLLNHDPHSSTTASPTNSHHSDFYPEPSRSHLGIWRNFTEAPSFLNLEHSSVPLTSIKMEPSEVPESDQFDFIINEILKKPSNDNASSSSRLSLVAEEISLQQNFWTQAEHHNHHHHNQQQQEQSIWICDICSKQFTTKQILQRHRIATHDQNKDFKCDQCDTWFSSSNNHELIKHVNEVHNGFKKFICDFPGCNKEFSRRDALKRHRTCHDKGRGGTVIQHPPKIAHSNHSAPIHHPYFRPHLSRH